MTTDPLFLSGYDFAPRQPPRLMPERAYASGGSEPGVLATLHLEEVRDQLRRLAAQQQPEDVEASFSDVHLLFEGGRVYARFLSPRAPGAWMLVHKIAYRHMAAEVLPRSGGRFLLQQSAFGAAEEMLTTLAWSTFAGKHRAPRLFRTVLTEDPMTGDTVRMIRSQHSVRYTAYDNLQFVEDLLCDVPDIADLPVLQFHADDSAMRLRFALVPAAQVATQPIPALSAWNSETGRKRVSIEGGVWKLVCTNGLRAWGEDPIGAWLHIGNTARISAAVQRTFQQAKLHATNSVRAYNDAVEIDIDDVDTWLRRELARLRVTQTFIARAREALLDPTTTPGSRLASAIDAVTLAAQDTENLGLQAEYEAIAAHLLQRGLAMAEDGRIRVAS